MKLMFVFIAGIFLLILGYSFLNFQGKVPNPIFPKIGIGLSLVGGAMFIGALILQMKKSREE